MKHIKKFNESDETKLDIEYIEHCFREVINVKNHSIEWFNYLIYLPFSGRLYLF